MFAANVFHTVFEDVGDDDGHEEVAAECAVFALPEEGNEGGEDHGDCRRYRIDGVHEQRVAFFAAHVEVEVAVDVFFQGAPAVEHFFVFAGGIRHARRVVCAAVGGFFPPQGSDGGARGHIGRGSEAAQVLHGHQRDVFVAVMEGDGREARLCRCGEWCQGTVGSECGADGSEGGADGFCVFFLRVFFDEFDGEAQCAFIGERVAFQGVFVIV